MTFSYVLNTNGQNMIIAESRQLIDFTTSKYCDGIFNNNGHMYYSFSLTNMFLISHKRKNMVIYLVTGIAGR